MRKALRVECEFEEELDEDKVKGKDMDKKENRRNEEERTIFDGLEGRRLRILIGARKWRWRDL